jgi:hypothetical protein
MSPTGSYDSRDDPGCGGMEGGYEMFIDEKKKKKSMGYVLVSGFLVVISVPSFRSTYLFPLFERSLCSNLIAFILNPALSADKTTRRSGLSLSGLG